MNPYLQLFRPVILLMGAVFLIAAVFIAGGGSISGCSSTLIFAVFAVMAFVAGGNSINDYVDREIDAAAHPARPIPSGRISEKNALYSGIAALIISAVFAFLLPNALSTAIVLAACVFILIYELFLKQKGLAGNITIGVLTGMVFLLGGAIAGNIQACYAVAAIIILISLGREIGLDIKDMEGDVGRTTLPMKIGKAGAASAAAVFFAAAVMLSLLPLLQNSVSCLYYLIILADAFTIMSAYSVFKRIDIFPHLVVTAMFLSAISFVLGAVNI